MMVIVPVLVCLMLVGCFTVAGEEPVPDIIRLRTGMSDSELDDVVFIGEQSVHLEFTSPCECRDLSVEMKDPIFETWLRGVARGEVEEGKKIRFGINMAPDVEPGTHDFNVWLNYTTDDGPVNRTYTFTLEVVKAWEVKDVHLPDGGDHELSVTFETFVDFHNITVLFGGDGDVGVKDEEIVLEDVKPGKHTVKTTVVKVDSPGWNTQEASWDLMGEVDNRTLQKARYNIPVDVSWGVPGFDAPLLFIAAMMVLLVVRRRTGRG